MSEYENVHHVTEFNNTLKQLAKTFGREKWVIVKYQGDYKYVHIYDNRKEANYPGITLGYDEFLTSGLFDLWTWQITSSKSRSNY